MRQFYRLDWNDTDEAFYDAVLNLSGEFTHVCLLDSNHYRGYPHSNFGSLMALGSIAEIKAEDHAFDRLERFCADNHDWVLGYLSYELRAITEPGLQNRHPDKWGWPQLNFFVPKYLLMFYEGHWQLGVHSQQELDEFTALLRSGAVSAVSEPVRLEACTSKERYLQTVEHIREHIRRGDIFEMNYCVEFSAQVDQLAPEQVYRKLDKLSQAPFGAFMKLGHRYLLCSSPERYLKKQRSTLISQPIKGTRKRSEDKEADEQLKIGLQNDAKERAENVMIVDLVRNDMSRVCEPGSVEVEELFGVYTFNQVHQMISTVTGQVRQGCGLAQVLKATFPMGSMTGAPKVKAMELIDKYEDQRRGLYSGAVGYITPGGNFDFNVVIRSLVYDAHKKYLSAMVGSAITEGSNAEMEYEECLLKLKGLQEALL